MLQEDLHTEICERRAKKYRGKLSLAHKLLVKLRAGPVQKLNLLHQLILLVRAYDLIDFRGIQGNLSGLSLLRPFLCVGKNGDLSAAALVNTLKVLSGTNGPVDGAGGDPQLLLNIVQQLEGVVCVPVKAC